MKTRSRVRTARVVTFQPVVFFGLVIVLLLGLPLVTAAQTPSLNWGSEVNPSRCPNDQGYRYLELNVTRHVEGDVALNRRTRHARDSLGRPRLQPAHSSLEYRHSRRRWQ